MFVIEGIRRLPLAMILGLALMVAGGVLDIVIHLGPVEHHAREAFRSEHVAHLVGIAGMTLVLAGVVIHRNLHRTWRASIRLLVPPHRHDRRGRRH